MAILCTVCLAVFVKVYEMLDTNASSAIASQRVAVTVINWNGREHLSYSIPQILKQDYGNFEVIVIDNASSDGSIEMLATEFPRVKIVANERNLGYTGAANVAMRYAVAHGFDLCMLLTNDVVLDLRCLAEAVKVFQQRDRIGMVGFNMIGALSYVPIEEFTRRVQEWKSVRLDETNYIEGAAFVAKPELLIRIGGFDEMLFLYGDENDIEMRLQRAGYQLMRINLPVWHNAGVNVMGKRKLHAAYYSIRNTLILWTKHYAPSYVLRGSLSLLRNACDPFIRIPIDDVMARRARPSNVFVNFGVLAVAVGGYIIKLPQVLQSRVVTRDLISAEKQRLTA